MRIRKMRRYRRRTVARPRKNSIRALSKRIRQKQAKKPEVKYFDYFAVDKVHRAIYATTASQTLFTSQHVLSGMLSSIAQGTGRNNRIGNRINVKFIKFTIFTRACPSTTTYNVGDYLLRCIVSGTGISRVTAGTLISEYFYPPVNRNIMGSINRTNVYTMFDKTYPIRAGWVTGAVNPDNFCGPCRKLTFNVPLGRMVEYLEGSNTVKNDRDFLSLMMLIGVPGMNVATDETQIACSDIHLRIYYTDV